MHRIELQGGIQLKALDRNVTLSDASAYNIQFKGPNPFFIDRLSFKRYLDSDFWLGRNQFCEQFLNPLLLRVFFGVSHNPCSRGTQEGVSTEDIARQRSWRRKFSRTALNNIVLLLAFHKKSSNELIAKEIRSGSKHQLPRVATV